MSNIFKQLDDLKSDASLGALSRTQKMSARASLMEAIGHNESTAQVEALPGGYVRWSFTNAVMRPMTAALVLVCFLIGGVSTVQVASASLPGETLYGLKLVTEQAQLRLSSLESKAVLHTEFAQRRLEEAVELSQSSDPAANEYAESAMTAFKIELELADDHLRQLQETGSEETVKIAQAIDSKIDELSSVIEESSSDGAEDVAEAEEAARAVSDTVTDVIVETHESSENLVSAHELSEMFKDDFREIQNRQTYDLGRVVVIGQALALNPELREIEALASVDTGALEFEITDATDSVSEAMNLMAAGGFRTAFDILQEVNSALLLIEERLVNIEIEITNGLMSLASAEDDSENVSEASSANEQDESLN